MDDEFLQKRIHQAAGLLSDITIVPLSTVDEDGMPRCTPVFMAFDNDLNGYWISHPESEHSRSITRDGRVMCAVFDSRQGGGGLFAAGRAVQVSDVSAIRHAYDTLAAKQGRDLGGTEQYIHGPQYLYQFIPSQLWVNYSEKAADGSVVRPRRAVVTLDALRQAVAAA